MIMWTSTKFIFVRVQQPLAKRDDGGEKRLACNRITARPQASCLSPSSCPRTMLGRCARCTTAWQPGESSLSVSGTN